MADHREPGPASLVTSPVASYRQRWSALTTGHKVRMGLALAALIASWVVMGTTSAPWGVVFGLFLAGYFAARATDPRTWRRALRKAASDFAYRWRNP